jgi:hypothetical protein
MGVETGGGKGGGRVGEVWELEGDDDKKLGSAMV